MKLFDNLISFIENDKIDLQLIASFEIKDLILHGL